MPSRLTPKDFAAAASGFRYLHLSGTAELVEQAQDAPSDDPLEQLDARYSALIPRDEVIGDLAPSPPGTSSGHSAPAT